MSKNLKGALWGHLKIFGKNPHKAEKKSDNAEKIGKGGPVCFGMV